MFQQVPMVEIDGMKMVQTRAILNYIAGKHNLYGKDLKERALIDMYVEATMDLNEMIMHHPLQPPEARAKHLASIIEKATTRYFPVYEKALKDHGQDFLVGNRFSRADVQLLETILIAEECKPDILSKFPVLQVKELIALTVWIHLYLSKKIRFAIRSELGGLQYHNHPSLVLLG
uniref:Glutathione S-transferase n=1 Tax=Chelydra serpentina TaxID=8475 RepID=A0A8C3XPM7_CHESE